MTDTTIRDDHDYKMSVRREWTATASGWRKWFDTTEADHAGRAITRVLLAHAGIRDGDVVLDVGTGYGEPGLSAAAAVGADGHVTCLDISGDMLAFAEERARSAGLSNVTFVEADIETARLDADAYDVVLSRATLMYAASPLMTLRRLENALRPGGRIALAVWATPDKVAFAVPVGVMVEMLGIEPPTSGPGPFALSEPGLLHALVEEAGFTEVESGTVTAVYVTRDPSECTQWIRDVAPPITELVAGEPPAVQEAVWNRVTEAWTPFRGADGAVALPCTALWVAARKRDAGH